MKAFRNTRRPSGVTVVYPVFLAVLVALLLVFSPGFAAGVAAVWALYVAFVVMLGLAYLGTRGWQAYADWRASRTPMAIVRRARGER